MLTVLARRIEEASLNAWPALQQMVLDGWLLRFAGGYTKRANSVNPLYESQGDIDHKIDYCERTYRARGLPAIFRLTPFAPPTLNQILETRGYLYADRTAVMHLDLARYPPDVRSDLGCRYLERPSVEDWLGVLCRLRREPLGNHGLHRSILQTILGERLLASLVIGDLPVACGLGVLEDGMVGIFDVLTGRPHRNKGYGTKLMVGLLARARQAGAQHAYLQVMCSNAPAWNLYTELGFQELYTYWYRIQSVEGHK